MDLVARLEVRFTLLGSRQPACERCGETNAFTLQRSESGVVCANCAAVGSGKRPTEAHHVAGRHNSDVTAEIPASDHRVLSRLQDHWPWDTLVNPDSSPLLAAAAGLRGWSDVMEVIVDRVLPGIAPALEELDRRLVQEWGEQWWRQRGIEAVTRAVRVAVRGWITPDYANTQRRYLTEESANEPVGPSDFTLVFDTETTTDDSQRIRFGTFQLRHGDILKDAGVFYSPDEVTEDEEGLLAEMCRAEGWWLGTVWVCQPDLAPW